MSSGVKVEGFDKLVSKIKKLADDKDKKREFLVILRQVAKPTLETSRQMAPVSKERHFSRGKFIAPGNLKKSLGLITSKSENPTILVGARAKGKFDGWYAHFVHEGHEFFSNGKKKPFVFSANRVRKTTVRNKKKESSGRYNKSKKTALRKIGKSSKTSPNRFLRNAYEATQSSITIDAEKRFVKFLQRRIDKLGE